MHRPIKFRGKSVHNNEWVYGNFIHSKRFEGCGNEFRIHNQDTGLESDVNPETVGQFTGLLDKNGKEIFEGDRITATAILEDSSGYDSKFQIEGEVQYNEEYSAFAFTDYVKSPVEQYAALLYQLDPYTIEIIYNIHDNQKLLKL